MEIFLGAFTAEWEQRKAAFLHDLSLGRRALPEEDERRRRGGAVRPVGSTGKAKAFGFRFRSGVEGRADRVQRRADRPMRARLSGLASGSQPAVVKMASFGGGTRLGAMINYVSRNGAIVVENERGDQLRGRDQISAVGDEWDHLMKNRAESRDIGLFKIAVAGIGQADADLFKRAREIVKRGLGDRAFAFAVTARADGSGFEIEGVAVLRNADGERLTADDKAATIVQRRLESAGASAEFRFSGYGNGTEYGTSQLRSLVAMHAGKVQDEQGRTIADAKQAGDLVQLEWRNQLHSRKPREVMHLILSARAGTDTAAFQSAARDFLGEQFASHRYVFSLHDAGSDPKGEAAGGRRPHVHVHAIVAMRSDAGDRVETTIVAFRQWRLLMAEKARAHGISMEMTDRRDRASAPAYSKSQVRPVNTIGRTQHEGTSVAAGLRYEAKRDDHPGYPATVRSRVYMQTAYREWQGMRYSQTVVVQKDFIRSQMDRLVDPRAASAKQGTVAHEAGNSGSHFRTHLVKFAELVSEGDNMRHITRPEFEAYEKRVETALFQAERTVASDEKDGLMEISRIAREHVAARRELMESTEEQTSKLPAPRESLSRAAEREDEQRRWIDAVERHGPDAAAAANKALVDIERVRGAIEQQGLEQIDDGARTLKEELRLQLSKAAELGASGNALIRDAAEIDVELRTAILSAERERRLADRGKREWSGATDPVAGPGRDAASDKVVQDPATVGKTSSSQEGSARTDAKRSGDTTKDDPAKRHVPRLEALQRQAGHDRDDRER